MTEPVGQSPEESSHQVTDCDHGMTAHDRLGCRHCACRTPGFGLTEVERDRILDDALRAARAATVRPPGDEAGPDEMTDEQTAAARRKVPARQSPGDEAGLRAALDAIEAACPVCGGAGWVTESDPNDPSGSTPMQVQCWDAEHTVLMKQRAALAAKPDQEEPGLDAAKPADGTHTHGGFIQGSSARVDG